MDKNYWKGMLDINPFYKSYLTTECSFGCMFGHIISIYPNNTLESFALTECTHKKVVEFKKESKLHNAMGMHFNHDLCGHVQSYMF